MSTTVNMPVELISSGLMEKARELCKGKRIKPEELLQAFEKALPYFRDGGYAGDRLCSYNHRTRRPSAWVVKVGQTNKGGRFIRQKSAAIMKCYSGAKASEFARALNALYGHYKQLQVVATAQKHAVDALVLSDVYEYIRRKGFVLSEIYVLENPHQLLFDVVGLDENLSLRLLIRRVDTKERAEAYCAAIRELCQIS